MKINKENQYKITIVILVILDIMVHQVDIVLVCNRKI
jgi:hypothetical protein